MKQQRTRRYKSIITSKIDNIIDFKAQSFWTTSNITPGTEFMNNLNNKKLNNDITPKGFRMPGWGCNQESAKAIGENYTYTAAHQNINQNIHFGNKVFNEKGHYVYKNPKPYVM